jgi:hypothetical protein
MKIAILDDYQNVALTMADWSRVESKAEITVFNDDVGEPDAVVARLQPFDIGIGSRWLRVASNGSNLRLTNTTGGRRFSSMMSIIPDRCRDSLVHSAIRLCFSRTVPTVWRIGSARTPLTVY